MSRNYVKHQNGLHWAMVMKWVAVLTLLAALGLSYILFKNQIVRIAGETGKQEQELRYWQERNRQLGLAIATLKSPQHLQRFVSSVNAKSRPQEQLVRVQEEQLVRVERGGVLRLARATVNP